jgi:hypothetical protein
LSLVWRLLVFVYLYEAIEVCVYHMHVVEGSSCIGCLEKPLKLGHLESSPMTSPFTSHEREERTCLYC